MRIVLSFQTVDHALRYKVEYTDDDGVTWHESGNSPATSSPVTVLENPPEGVYKVRLTAIGDGTNYLDSGAVVSSDVIVDIPAIPLEDPVIDSVEVET